NDGWYRRQAGGNWNFYAPTQGQVQRGQIGLATGAQPAGAGGGYRIATGPNAPARTQGRGDRVPNAGAEVRAQEVAALERQHYARALGQMRAQNYRPAGNFSRSVGRRR